MKNYTCHVCGYPDLDEAPWGDDEKSPSYNICPCCGVEFGYEDSQDIALIAYRNNWIKKGAKWFTPSLKPDNWNLEEQLRRSNIKTN
ncbi:hypothetical protein [Desulfitobacterium hafniense]|uniref:Rubredoxin-like domain-containing protein n=4 Tax=root TaxID=1 RepID=Q24QQ4_DESHY|nr:hypothetical protein [Desulfitobacterium hafniense]EHL06763.1 hypothetical protein HMPREF0322_02551 [Desulfitobacterium hafniense DP7]KTE89389.1 hypothetical protein AT727_13405 [Desulfitobacterium hafniense]MEA5023424.1 hypothetical protein [Desulfitobacterium hafniense]CDX04039.1 Hypothetical protein DPCES_4153 [Desulfitobacterium hafniense]BAE85638.1 hypothetical protein DSY3849 [Desulfitobacterium hafniense Y51]